MKLNVLTFIAFPFRSSVPLYMYVDILWKESFFLFSLWALPRFLIDFASGDLGVIFSRDTSTSRAATTRRIFFIPELMLRPLAFLFALRFVGTKKIVLASLRELDG